MNQNMIEKRLRAQAQQEARQEFFEMRDEIERHPIMKQIYKLDRQKKIFENYYTNLLTGMTPENVEAAITKRAEQIYNDKVDDLLRKMDSLQYFFDQGQL